MESIKNKGETDKEIKMLVVYFSVHILLYAFLVYQFAGGNEWIIYLFAGFLLIPLQIYVTSLFLWGVFEFIDFIRRKIANRKAIKSSIDFNLKLK